MCRVVNGIWRLRATVLTLAGVLGVHQGRYLFATPAHEHQLAGVHGYLPWLIPLAGALVFLAIAHLAVRLGRPARPLPELPGAKTLWAAATLCLIHVFALQECAETLLADGRLPLLTELFGAGGWTAIPLAVAAGAAITLLLRGAARAVRWALARRRPRASRRRPAVSGLPSLPLLAPRQSVLARRMAGRAPPALS
jgi:hypothetical protein